MEKLLLERTEGEVGDRNVKGRIIKKVIIVVVVG